MDHPEEEISFFDSSNLTPDELKYIKEILSAKKNGQVKFPWDTSSSASEKKQDENGNNISQQSYCVGEEQPEPFTVSQSVNTNVVLPGMIPVGSECMPMHSTGLTHVYPTTHFVGYPPVNHEMMLSSHPAIPLAHPVPQGIHPGNSHDSSNVEVGPHPIGQVENMMSVEDQMDIATQPVHHLPYSTLTQPFPPQSAPALFYSPNGPAPPRGQPFFYIPVPYQPPPYPVHQNVPVTMAANPCVIDENIVTAVEPVSNVMYCDSQDIYNNEQFLDEEGMDQHDHGFFEEQAVNSENIHNDAEIVEISESNRVSVCPSDLNNVESNYSDENTDVEHSGPLSDNEEIDSPKTSSVEAECDKDNCQSASENDNATSDHIDDCGVSSNSTSKPRSWASLFSQTNVNCVDLDNRMTNGNSAHESIQIKTDFNNHHVMSIDENSANSKTRGVLSRFQVSHRSVHLQPCGLVNKSNWCYINAVLQALLVCPPFYNLMKEMPVVPDQKISSTPILDSLAEFVHSFMTFHLNNFKNKRKDDLSVRKPFEPRNIYRMLSGIRSSCIKGRQEDAEEFLSCILDGIHEEMLAIMKNNCAMHNNSMRNGVAPSDDISSKMNGSTADDDWLVIGGKNKGVVTRSVNYMKSPISDIFGGQLRSLLKRSGTDPTANLEPFFTLQLDVQSDQVSSIKDALHGLVSKEAVEGFVCAKTGNEVEASRRLTLEELPPVLILHIKRFVYNKDGGCQKVLKQVEYEINLELSIDLLSSEVKMKYKKMRSYKLFAVVYHDGKEAVKGHYITDAYHSGSNGWLRFDDSSVHRISESQVLKHCPPRVPYLLFYKQQCKY